MPCRGFIEARCARDGSLVAIEEAIAVFDRPNAVTSAVQRKYLKATIAKAQKNTHGHDVQYEVTLRKTAKKEVLLMGDGQIVREE
jgi:hypothetical protein